MTIVPQPKSVPKQLYGTELGITLDRYYFMLKKGDPIVISINEFFNHIVEAVEFDSIGRGDMTPQDKLEYWNRNERARRKAEKNEKTNS